MNELLTKIPDIVQIIALVGMCISILATILVRITPSQSDDEKVNGLIQKFQKLLSWLPTLGLNPNTKKLQEALDEINKKNG